MSISFPASTVTHSFVASARTWAAAAAAASGGSTLPDRVVDLLEQALEDENVSELTFLPPFVSAALETGGDPALSVSITGGREAGLLWSAPPLAIRLVQAPSRAWDIEIACPDDALPPEHVVRAAVGALRVHCTLDTRRLDRALLAAGQVGMDKHAIAEARAEQIAREGQTFVRADGARLVDLRDAVAHVAGRHAPARASHRGWESMVFDAPTDTAGRAIQGHLWDRGITSTINERTGTVTCQMRRLGQAVGGGVPQR